MGRASRRKRERGEGDPPAEWTVFEAQVERGRGRPFVKLTSGLGDDAVFSTRQSPAVTTALGLRAIQAAIEAERDAGFIAWIVTEFGPQLDLHGEDAERFAAMALDGLRRYRRQFDADAGSMAALFPDDPSELTDEPPAGASDG